jgi:hypothetical protein
LTLAQLPAGSPVQVVGARNEWCRILPLESLRAYVHAEYVDLSAAEAHTTGPATAPPRGSPRNDPATPRAASAQPAGGVTTLPDAVAERLAFARELLSQDGSVNEAESALRLLEEAIGDSGLTQEQRTTARARAAAVVGSLPPSKWLQLLELARRSQEQRLDRVRDRFRARIRDARAAVEGAPDIEFTVQGTLRAPQPGSYRYRLLSGDVLVCELDAGDADISFFYDSKVGVVGRRHQSAQPGGVPWVEVDYIEQLAPPGREGQP